jgi:hypothetical protein
MLIPNIMSVIESMKTRSIKPKVVGFAIIRMATTIQRIPTPTLKYFLVARRISSSLNACIIRAIPIIRRAMAARTINKATLNSGNSIRMIDRPITKSPNAIFMILEDLYFDAFVDVVVVVVVVAAAVAVIVVVLTTPKQILSIPITSKTSDKRSTVVVTDEPGINKITAANKAEIEPSTIWSIRSQGGVRIICIIFTLLVPQRQEVLYKYLASQ